MKISFGPNDYVEMIGSGENGTLTEQEFELFKSSVNKFFDERREKLEQEKNKINQKNIKEISTRCSEIVKNVCYAVSIASSDHDIQEKVIDYFADGYDPALDGLDLTEPKDEEETKPETLPSTSLNA